MRVLGGGDSCEDAAALLQLMVIPVRLFVAHQPDPAPPWAGTVQTGQGRKGEKPPELLDVKITEPASLQPGCWKPVALAQHGESQQT